MGGGGYLCNARPKPALRPAKASKTAPTRAVDIKLVGTQPLQSILCTVQLALSTVVENKVRETKSTETDAEKSSVVLRSLRHYLRAQSQGHHTIDHLEERGVKRGSARRSSLKGRERAIVNQTNIGTVSKETLGKRLTDVVERIWAFPSE